MSEGLVNRKEKWLLAAAGLTLLGYVAWTAWGAPALKIHSAKRKILVELARTDAAFRDVRIGNDRDSVCGWVAIQEGGPYLRFMVDRVAPVVDPGSGSEGLKAILWEDYPTKCTNLKRSTTTSIKA